MLLRAVTLSAVLAAPLALTAPGASAAPARFEIDPTHFSVVFSADHIGFGATWGMFLNGAGGFTYDEATQSLTDLSVTIDAASVFSNDERRDGHLRSKDFLDASAHPDVTFVMTSAEPTGATTGRVTGDLTLRGVTKPVVLEVVLNRIADYPFGHRKRTIGVTATTVIKRSEFGMTYAVEGGLVGDAVPITIELEAIQQD